MNGGSLELVWINKCTSILPFKADYSSETVIDFIPNYQS